MKLFKRLTIRFRLIILVSVAAAGMLMLGLMGLNSIGHSNESLASVYKESLVPTGQISEIIGLMRDNRTQLLLSLQHDPASTFSDMHNHPLDVHVDRVSRNIDRISEVWKDYLGRTLSAEEQALADEFATTRGVFVEEGLKPVLDALRAGDYAQANRILLTKVNPAFGPANTSAEKLFRLQLDTAGAAFSSAENEYASTRNGVLALIAVGLLVLAGVAWYTTRSIDQAVRSLDEAATKMGAGDLTARSAYQGNDELGHVARAFNSMGEKFEGVIRELAGATGQLASAAEETSAVTEQTTSGIQQQQAEIDQVATAMNEMNATVHEVAQNATRAAQSATEADTAAGDGKRVVSRTIDVIDKLANEVERAAEAIHNLEQESEQIGTVLDVIRGIAEQTNLLALNAAIEAARAGEQGRGFAVVADEVRTLAQRTQQSIQEIQAMIERLQTGASGAVQVMESSRTQAQDGVRQAAEAGSALDTITAAVNRIADMNTQIASAAEEQTAVAEEINRNISNINGVAEQTTEGAGQTAAASQELARLAEHLQGLVAKFRV